MTTHHPSLTFLSPSPSFAKSHREEKEEVDFAVQAVGVAEWEEEEQGEEGEQRERAARCVAARSKSKPLARTRCSSW